jgi:MarR family transcriptional regulator, transcriptional regulator for hemolysin
MEPPELVPPIGLRLARTARVVTAEFERSMAQAGGSASTWQVLLLIRAGQSGTQSEMAEQLGITGATLTHHMSALERRGLVRRWREAGNRRVQRAELTPEGVELFDRLRTVATGYDERLRALLGDQEVRQFAELLDRLRAGVSSAVPAGD